MKNLSPEKRQALNEAIKLKWNGKKDYSEKTKPGGEYLDLPLEDFARISAQVNGQQYGPGFQKWMQNYFNWTEVDSKLGRGDSLTSTGKYIEQKWGIRADCGPGAMQVRPWEKNDYYIFGHVDPRDPENLPVDIYLLTHDDVVKEAEILKSSSTHGTKKINKENTHSEVSLGVKIDSPDHLRWKEKYLVDDSILRSI